MCGNNLSDVELWMFTFLISPPSLSLHVCVWCMCVCVIAVHTRAANTISKLPDKLPKSQSGKDDYWCPFGLSSLHQQYQRTGQVCVLKGGTRGIASTPYTRYLNKQ